MTSNDKMPTVLIGYIQGKVRVESFSTFQPDAFLNNSSGWIIYTQPFAWGCDTRCISPLQKRSKYGFLLMRNRRWWQWVIHAWYTFKEQERTVGGGWIPGSERVLYWRAGYSRWQRDCNDPYVMGYHLRIGRRSFTIPFGTWYGPGLRWD